jgi:hypothetical protein
LLLIFLFNRLRSCGKFLPHYEDKAPVKSAAIKDLAKTLDTEACHLQQTFFWSDFGKIIQVTMKTRMKDEAEFAIYEPCCIG